MPPLTMDTAWHADALRMRDQGDDAVKVGDAVGKHPATVRKLFARNPEASTNGHGDPAHIPGQTTVDDHLEDFSPPEDDPEYEPPAEDVILAEDDPEHPDSLAAFRGEAGEAVGPMQARPGEEPPEPLDFEPEEITVHGTAQLGLFEAGGRTPDSASVRLAGGKVALVFGEAFRKGDAIHFSGTAVVTAIKQQDKRDGKTGQVVGCEQQHTALITDLTVG